MPKSKTKPEVNDFFNVRPSTSIPVPQRPSLTTSQVILSQMSTGDKDTSTKKLMKKLLQRKVSLQVSSDTAEEKLGQCRSEWPIQINAL